MDNASAYERVVTEKGGVIVAEKGNKRLAIIPTSEGEVVVVNHKDAHTIGKFYGPNVQWLRDAMFSLDERGWFFINGSFLDDWSKSGQ